MNFRTILCGIVAGALVLACGASADADTIIVYDDFNDDSGTLLGETANTGQTWTASQPTWVSGSLDTGVKYGQSGTVGAGHATTGGRGNYLGIGPNIFTRQALMDLGGGTYTVSVDMNKGWAQEMGLEVLDGTSGFTIMWAANQLKIGGSQNHWSVGAIQPGTGSGYGGQIHVDFTIAVETDGNSTATLSYYGIADPDGNPYAPGTEPSGSVTGNTYGGNFAYDGITLWAERSGGAPTPGEICAGFDNVSIIQSPIPEPSVLTLLAVGLGMLVLRRSGRD